MSIGQVQYVYIALATCDVLEHFKIEDGKLVGLEDPKWHGDYSYFHQGTIAELKSRLCEGEDSNSD